MDSRPRRSFISRPRPGGAALVRRHKADHWLLILGALLITIGLVVVYSISPGLAASQQISQNYYVTKQIVAVSLSLVAFWIASSLKIDFWRRVAKPLAIVAAVGCLVVMVTPINAAYPAHRWIRLGGFSFQIAELIKLALMVYLAGFITSQWQKGRVSDYNSTLKPLVILVLVLGVVVAKLQSDLGSAGVMVIMIGAMAFTAGVPLKKIALLTGVIILLGTVAIASSPYRRERLANYLHPNCQGSGYQACQALIAVGSGGVMGLGLGYSVQAYGYLPEASNDSIFAIIAEKFGFIGSFLILVIYGVFIARLKYIIERTVDPFSRLMVVAFMAWFSTQVIINVGAMVGLLPLKGITLPLVSQGGTSLIFLATALGIVFQISRYTSYKVTEPDIHEKVSTSGNSFDGRGIRRPHNPPVITRPRA